MNEIQTLSKRMENNLVKQALLLEDTDKKDDVSGQYRPSLFLLLQPIKKNTSV